MKKNILLIVLGIIIGTSIGVYAINASEINYNNTTVDSALDYLYNHVGSDIGQTYSSINYGHERLTSMSTNLELPKGKYLCSTVFSMSTAINEKDYEASGNNTSLIPSGCDSIEAIKNNYIGSGATEPQLSSTSTYHLLYRLSYIFKCDVNATKTISVSATNTAVNWIPWIMSLDCTSIE